MALSKSLFMSAGMLLATNVFAADFFCSTVSNFNNIYGAHGASMVEASMNAVNACKAGENSGIFCENRVDCEQSSRWDTYFCSTESNFHNTYGGRGASRAEAAYYAVHECTAREGNGMFCKNAVSCQAE